MAARPEQHEEPVSAEEQLLALKRRVAELEEERRLIYKDFVRAYDLYWDLLSSIDRLQAEAFGRFLKHPALYAKLFETPRWLHLETREHPWRAQLYVKGRNVTVGQLAAAVTANNLSAEKAAEDFDLPLEAINEALHYAKENPTLLEYEAARERSLLFQAEDRRAAGAVPG